MRIEHWTDVAANWVSALAELAAAAIILVGIGHALFQWGRRVVRGESVLGARSGLGRYIVLALEFLVAADILTTAVTPTWSRLGQVAVIIALRMVLSYFLEWEIQRGSE